ncbi:MAG: helix-turn-helix transcriptional regulator [Candidatus Omnitrophica bacterium]|nr:helix-turn-helix transcriptional regulator [Candidatus Omnitrophota bacterium]MBI4435935.1 helix-turn-helix transcriptional regulator [Candidatus Omnitrophota bacterium]
MFIIKSEDQRQKTLKRIENVKAQIQRVQRERGLDVAKELEASTQEHIRELEEQVREYDCLRKEGVGSFRPRNISEVGQYLIKARIAARVTQAELAKQLNVSQPMVYKYELVEYQGASLEVLLKAAKALRVSLDIEAVALQPKKWEGRRKVGGVPNSTA